MIKKIITHKHFIILFIIICLGLLLRLYRLSEPLALDVDEYSIGYNAFSIAHAGIDEWGFRFPLFFRAFGDYKLPFDIYFVALLFKIFGTHDFLIKIPALVCGILFIPLIYSLSLLVFKNRAAALLGALLTAVSPYGIFYSRIISGSISEALCVVASITSFIYFLRYKQNIFVVISFLLLSLSLYTYPSAWIFAPLLFLSYLLVLVYKKYYQLLPLSLIFIVLFIPIFYQFFRGGSSVRLGNTTYKGTSLEINEFREHTKSSVITKIFHNKPVYFIYNLSYKYLKHFDSKYLLFRKGEGFQESSYPPLYIVFVPLYLVGLVTLFRKRKDPIFFILLMWVLISPIPSAITEGDVNPKRYLSFFGSETILILLGMSVAKNFIKQNKFLVVALAIFTIFKIFDFVHFYSAPQEELVKRHQILTNAIRTNYSSYDKIVYSSDQLSEPQIYPLYTLRYPPEKYIAVKQYVFNNWYFIKPFDKIYYSSRVSDIIHAISSNASKKIYLLVNSDELKQFPKNICYSILKKHTIPKRINKFWYETTIHPCS